jgi:hypothetical protein
VTRLTGWALAVATLCVAASLTAFVNVAFVQPRPGPSGLDWQLALQYAGGASATVLVAGAGAVVGIRARRRCTGILGEPLPAGSPSSGAAG